MNILTRPWVVLRRYTQWAARNDVRKYGNALLVNIITIGAQISLVLASGSLALRADTFHLGSDSIFTAGAFAVSLLGLALSQKWDKRVHQTFALIGIGLLLYGAYHVSSEAALRSVHPQNIATGWALAGGVLGGLGSVLVYAIFHNTKKCRHDHVHTVFKWHVVFDFLFSVAVVYSASHAIITGAESIDTSISVWLARFMFVLSGYLFAKVQSGQTDH